MCLIGQSWILLESILSTSSTKARIQKTSFGMARTAIFQSFTKLSATGSRLGLKVVGAEAAEIMGNMGYNAGWQ